MQDFGQPPLCPSGRFPDKPYFEDLFEAMTNAFDDPTVLPFINGGGVVPMNDEDFMDPLGLNLGAMEKSIEETVSPPSGLEGPPLPLLPPEQVTQGFLGEGSLLPTDPIMPGNVSDGPPLPPEPAEHQWTTLKPPLPAKPYFTPDGLTTPSYRPSGRVGTGARNNSQNHDGEQYCPADDDWVPQKNCQSCTYYDPEAATCKHHNSNEKP